MISHLLHCFIDSTLAPDQICIIYLGCMYIELLYVPLLVLIWNSKSCVPNFETNLDTENTSANIGTPEVLDKVIYDEVI